MITLPRLIFLALAATVGACSAASDPRAARSNELPPPAVAVAAAPARGEGGGEGRGRHWDARMAALQARSRAELGLDEATANRLMTMQTELRSFRRQLHREAAEKGLTRDEGQAKLHERMRGFELAVGELLGPDRAHRYMRLMAETTAAKRSQ